MDSTNVLIEGVHFAGSSMWTIHLLYTDNAVVRNVIIETYPGVHTDGIAVDSSRNVRISDCYIDTGDDGIVIKSGKDADGLRVNRPTENVSIVNCTVHHAHGAVTIGSETSGWIRNLMASNITCDGTQMGVRIKSSRGRGGGVEDVRFDNWTMENVGQAINVTKLLSHGRRSRDPPPQPVSERTPVFRNIAISHMTINHARVAIDIEGLPEMPISGSADQRRDRVGEDRHESLQHRRPGTASRAGERRRRAGFSGAGFEGTGTGRRLDAQAAGGNARDPVGPLPRRHGAAEPGVCRHRHVSLGRAGRTEERRARRERARQRAEGGRGVEQALSDESRETDRGEKNR